jgi:hypothetical protein
VLMVLDPTGGYNIFLWTSDPVGNPKLTRKCDVSCRSGLKDPAMSLRQK